MQKNLLWLATVLPAKWFGVAQAGEAERGGHTVCSGLCPVVLPSGVQEGRVSRRFARMGALRGTSPPTMLEEQLP